MACRGRPSRAKGLVLHRPRHGLVPRRDAPVVRLQRVDALVLQRGRVDDAPQRVGARRVLLGLGARPPVDLPHMERRESAAV